jgi:hypothetical protein
VPALAGEIDGAERQGDPGDGGDEEVGYQSCQEGRTEGVEQDVIHATMNLWLAGRASGKTVKIVY